MTAAFIGIACFALGVIVGLWLGPDGEREDAASVNGWLSGAQFTRDSDATPRKAEGFEARRASSAGRSEAEASPK
jgi:hypothetical protein